MVFTSPLPSVAIPELSVFDFLFGSIEGHDLDRVALVDGGSGAETSYGQLIGQIHAVAGALAARGIGLGDVVALHAPNTPAFAAVFHGILRAGATATTVNALYTADDVASQLRDSGAKLLFTVSPLLPQAFEAASAVGLGSDDIVVLDGAEGYQSLRDLLGAGNPDPNVTFDAAETVAVLPYSSGTTARPKGVILTHRNLVANVAQSQPLITIGADDRVLAVLPFFHIYGMTVLLNLALSTRAALVTMPRFDLPEFLRIIQDHRITFVFIAPPIAVALAKHPLVDDYDLSSLNVVFSGAAPLDGALGAAVASRLDCVVRQGYGMSEMSPVSHAIPIDRDDIPLSSVGITLPNIECRLIDPATGEDIDVPAHGVSEAGELLCRGPNIMRGYLGNDEATRATLDDDGFLHTGDIATVSAEGFVTVVDRLKELIKYKGYQVAPAELEALLLTHPLIADAAVVGAHDADGEEVPKAFVVLQAGADLGADAVMAFVEERVAPYKKVRQVEFIDAIPKSASGKILRKDLRAGTPA
ncbi:4-coumarate--CoA ligase family protein [Glaciihabitans arcticus]|uniref:4-coumarate--CoA ligase family protein n=1 Tax=Glaciihabitans arcticus TaxID=2668039 RepID=A0A4Q9GUI7_9MICO|nr:AMP-binding protein [Glaciihabitans arcticus]TBN56837.1 4-coumarate--CoA ligase family protein [Glaciihabitans arcticus]